MIRMIQRIDTEEPPFDRSLSEKKRRRPESVTGEHLATRDLLGADPAK